MENMKNDKGYESDGGDSNTSVKTVKSQSGKEDNVDELRLSSQGHEMSRSTTGPHSMQSSVQVRLRDMDITLFTMDAEIITAPG